MALVINFDADTLMASAGSQIEKIITRKLANIVAAEKDLNYRIAATMFYRIVARTPYDEKYFYRDGLHIKGWEGQGRGPYITALDAKIMKETEDDTEITSYGIHIPDNMRAREQWHIVLGGDTSKYRIDLNVAEHFSSVNFGDNTVDIGRGDTRAVKQIEEILRNEFPKTKAGLPRMFRSIKFYNNANVKGYKYIDNLEFGRYERGRHSVITKGPKHIHGQTSDGYSVQAPKGMLRITMAEFQEIYREVKSSQKATDIKFYSRADYIKIPNYNKLFNYAWKDKKSTAKVKTLTIEDIEEYL